MKRMRWNLLQILVGTFVLLGCQSNTNLAMQEIDLNSNWQFRQVGEENWLKADVPGTVHTDLLANGVIEDPFYRLNEHDLQWIDKVDWEYKTIFEVSADVMQKDKLELNFKGLDTYAKVYLNDALVLSSENMFQEYLVDCKKQLLEGSNELRIVFESPIRRGIEKHDAIDFKIPVSNNDLAEIGEVEGNKLVSVFTRKAGYHFGWDWGPRLVSSGIWRAVSLKAWDAIKVSDLFVQQIELGEESAKMLAHIEVEGSESSESAMLEVLVDGKSIKKQKAELAQGLNTVQVAFEIENPKRWWPNGLGEQNLYDVQLRINNGAYVAEANRRIGLREVELIMEPDSIGTSFYFTVNGHPVFMKGANYIPQDVFLPRVSRDKYEHILQSAKDANMNMLRVWGGGIYENTEFYDMCDEMGLLVWQDFMFACAMFPGDEAFLASVKQEAIDNVKRLRNHTSIALWCGNNEILSAWENWGWKDQETKAQSKEVADIIWKAYDDIFHKILPEVVAEFDSDRAYWPSSPGSAFGEKEDADGTKGDMHYWGVWWGKEPFANYEERMPRFMSEFGFQSFPELSTVEKYALPEDYDIYSEVMKSHQRSTIGNGTIKEYMLRHYREPKDFESFLYVSHLLQAQGIGFGIEAQRRNMHHCMGSLYWQINDCWPVASWSGIDYFGKWKALHYEVKRKFEEYIISFKVVDDELNIYVVSDNLEDVSGTLNIQAIDFNGNVINEINEEFVVEANSGKVYHTLALKQLLGDFKKNQVVIKGSLLKEETILAKQLFFLKPFKEIDFPQPEISVEVNEEAEQFVVTLSSKKLAKGVFVSSVLDGNFSDNYVDLLPGQNVSISIKKANVSLDDFKKSILIQSLVDSY